MLFHKLGLQTIRYNIRMFVVGMDEVGRGCWAGPTVVGAVILKQPIEGLKDSKQLSKRRREELDVIIRDSALVYAIGEASAAEIDELGLTEALRLAYRRALGAINFPYDEVLIDGDYNFLPDDLKARTLIKADATIPAVSAASIIAKVYRDNLMSRLSQDFPAYGFEKHVGYGTAVHMAALKECGPCVLHRRSFAPVAKLLRISAL